MMKYTSHIRITCINDRHNQVGDLPGEVWGKPKGGSQAGRKGNIGMDILNSDAGGTHAARRGSLLVS